MGGIVWGFFGMGEGMQKRVNVAKANHDNRSTVIAKICAILNRCIEVIRTV